ITYNGGLNRYLWCQTLPDGDARFSGGSGIYDAPEPWGPWSTVFYTHQWDVGPGETSSFPPKWMSADGKTLHLVFSGEDSFSVREARLELQPKTRVSIVNGRWRINDEVTYRDAPAKGLLLNVRAVNAVFEDRNHPTFDPAANTGQFISRVS